jgi:hypothetical protein
MTALCAFVACHALGASDAGAEHEIYPAPLVKAAFIYRFGGYVSWPPAAMNTPWYTIAVLDDNEIADQLDRLAMGHEVQKHPVRVARIKSIREIGDAQMLYVSAAHSGDLSTLLEPLARRPILIVTDAPKGLKDGAEINFLPVEHRVRFEISLAAAKESGLTISSELLGVAARVD